MLGLIAFAINYPFLLIVVRLHRCWRGNLFLHIAHEKRLPEGSLFEFNLFLVRYWTA